MADTYYDDQYGKVVSRTGLSEESQPTPPVVAQTTDAGNWTVTLGATPYDDDGSGS